MTHCPTCGRGGEQLEQLLQEERNDRQNIEAQLRKVLREKTALQRELSKQRQQSPKADEARAVFEHWLWRLGKDPKRTKFTPERQKLILSMLKEYELGQLKKAIDGLALRPHSGPRGRSATRYPGSVEHHTQLVHAIGTADRIEACWRYVDEADAEAEAARRDGERRRQAATTDLASRYGPNPETGEPRWAAHLFGLDGVARLVEALARFGSDAVQRGHDATRFMAQCPAHDDRDPSLSILEKPDGRVLIHCFGGCKPGSVLEAIGLDFSDLGGRCALTDDRARELGMRRAA